jgi:hypothetical protein
MPDARRNFLAARRRRLPLAADFFLFRAGFAVPRFAGRTVAGISCHIGEIKFCELLLHSAGSTNRFAGWESSPSVF